MGPPAPAFLRSCNSLPPTPLEVERAPRPGQKGRKMRPGWRSTRNSKLGRRESPRRWTWAARRQPCAGRSIERQRGGFRKATTITRIREFINCSGITEGWCAGLSCTQQARDFGGATRAEGCGRCEKCAPLTCHPPRRGATAFLSRFAMGERGRNFSEET